MGERGVVVGLLAVLLLGLPALGVAPTAAACSCAVGTDDLSAPRRPAEVLFEGRVVRGEETAGSETVWTVEVGRVLRGEVTAVQPVVARDDGAACGRDFTVGETYLVAATPDGRPGVLATSLCTVTRESARLTADDRRTLAAIHGPGRPPEAPPPAPVPELPRPVDPLVVLVGGALAGVVLVVALGAVLLRRRRAQR